MEKLPEEAKKLWNMLSSNIKSMILHSKPQAGNNSFNFCPGPKPPSLPLPRCNVNEHDIEKLIACLHDVHGGSQPDITDGDGSISYPEDSNHDN